MDRTMIDRTADQFALPSRQEALAACRNALGEGLVIVTGEPGVGKTWLGRQLAAMPPAIWITTDVFPGMTAADLHGSLGNALGLGRTPSRTALARTLVEVSTNGRLVSLILDEAHLASMDVLEEVRILSNRLGRPDGFAAVVLLGQTPLRVRLESRPMQGLRSRLEALVHLRPLDADEAQSWLSHSRPGQVIGRDNLEWLHREAGGNPRLLVRLAARWTVPSIAVAAGPVATPRSNPAPEPLAAPLVSNRQSHPSVVPVKPPLRVEDGMIEVGYAADSETDPDDEPEVGPRTPAVAFRAGETPIDDHYAALQAWDEWVRNQGRAGMIDELELDADSGPTSQSWADSGQPFAPYSQLFSRLKTTETDSGTQAETSSISAL